MTFPKIIFISALVLFTGIGVVALFKSDSSKKVQIPPMEVQLPPPKVTAVNSLKEVAIEREFVPEVRLERATNVLAEAPVTDESSEKINLVPLLFNKGEPKLPIVETITYKSRISWMKGRPAWLSDYAGHYETSRHFIARSLNGTPDYFKQDVSDGDRFNVFKLDKQIEFYLVLDVNRCRLRLYYYDKGDDERVLLKTYVVGVGRSDPSRTSGLLTPLGKYSLGSKVAIYKPKMMGHHNGQRIEMLRIFGTRWIPFEKEIVGCTAPAKDLVYMGFHGARPVAEI